MIKKILIVFCVVFVFSCKKNINDSENMISTSCVNSTDTICWNNIPWKTNGSWSVNSSNELHFQGNNSGQIKWVKFNSEKNNFIIEVELNKLSGDSGDSMGIIVRADNSVSLNGFVSKNFYNFFTIAEISPSQAQYSVGRVINDTYSHLVAWKNSSSLSSGFNLWNKLKVDVNGNSLKFYINGTLVESITDNNFTTGNIYLALSDLYTNTQVKFRNFSIQ